MVSLVDAQQYPPPTDLQTDAVRLCIAFQSQLNPEFLGAATELLSCVATLSPAEFRRHSRKIIRLIETARDTLEASGISLYLFTAASCQKGKWKDVYFDLLRMLQTRRVDVDDSLEGARTNSLLVRLSSNFVGRQSAVASSSSPARTSLPDKSRKSLALGITTCTPQPDTANTAAPCITMPPPDAFPSRPPQSFPRRKRTSPLLPFRLPPAVMSSRKRTRHRTQPENKIPTSESASSPYAYKLPPLAKRFGIFSTGKSSMHQYRRPQATRAY
ncbi:hypothetical protein DFH08DRAFT_856288 [Mycena albidolilacea]|uniref:Uncharacterized protein n=1 Tax=Mycena albidolilacea TaxID=1033008 RepID=A0AAD7EVC1_9AGAR|nr:hypothetical protein DFH08DRAFT_856288 [Mycena albidolilacea]